MAERKTPEFGSWDELQLVVSNVALIVDDAPPSNALFGFMGLLDLAPKQPPPQNHESRLKSQLKATPTLLTQGDERRLIEVLPGIDDIGSNRAQRLEALTRRLSELKAYHWLSAQPAFGSARAALKRLAKSSPVSKHARDDALFLMLNALIFPLRVYQLLQAQGKKSSYPTKADVQEAYRHARALNRFFNDHTPVYGLFDMPGNVWSTLDVVVRELDANRNKYTKPKDNGQINERDFRDQLVRRLYREFDACSKQLVSPLLGLVNYEMGERDLVRCINELLGPEKMQHSKMLERALAKIDRDGA